MSVQEAAVSVVVRTASPEEVLLVKRAESASDPWSGDVALPGGRRDPEDHDLAATARRETFEETGLDISGHRPLLTLDAVTPISRRLPRLVVTPFVYEVASGAQARPASREIQSVHWVKLVTLAAPATRSTISAPRGGPGAVSSYPCYRIGGLVIWGLTYRILSRFLRSRRASYLPSSPS